MKENDLIAHGAGVWFPDLIVQRTTEKAMLVKVSDESHPAFGEEIWMPKSQITIAKKLTDNKMLCEIPVWLLKEKGLNDD